jgi:hypothetical protein
MAQYINIGSTCAVFDQDSTNIPGNSVLSGVYILDTSNSILKNTPVPTGSGYSTLSASSNSVNYSDLQFKVWFSQDLVRSAYDRQTWRYLSPQSISSVPTYSTSAPVVNQTVALSSGGSWPANANSPISILHPAVSTYSDRIVTESNSDFTAAINNIVSYPTISTVTYDNTRAMYLFKKTDTTSYLKLTGSVLSIAVTSNPAEIGPATPFYFHRVLTPGVGARLVLSSTSGSVTEVTNSRVELNTGTYEIVIQGSGVSGVDTTYTITPTQPNFGPVEAGFPSDATIIKSASTGKYMFWNGGSTISSLSVRDYWTSGISADGIRKGMQFWFRDQTYLRDYSGSTPMVDWYKWGVVNDITNAPSTAGNTSNVTINSAGTTLAIDGTNPANTEGWVFSNTVSPYYLMYVKASGGQMSNVGYLSVSTGDSITYTQGTPTLNSANMWLCNKCTPVTGQSYCDTTGVVGSQPTQAQLFSITVTNPWGVQLESTGNVLVLSNTFAGSSTLKYSKSTGSTVAMPTPFNSLTSASAFASDGVRLFCISLSFNAPVITSDMLDGRTSRWSASSTASATSVISLSTASCLATDSSYLYIGTSGGTVLRHNKTLNSGFVAFTSAISVANPIRGLAVDASYIYVVQNGTMSSGTGVARYNLDGTLGPNWSARAIWNFGIPGAYGIAIDTTHMYISTTTGNVLKYDKSTGATVAFTISTITGMTNAYGIAVDETDIYVTSQSLNLVRKYNKVSGAQVAV